MYHDPWLLHHISIYCISWECSSSQEKRPPVFIRFFSHGDLENQHNFICHLPRLHAWFRGFASRDISPTPLSTYTIRLMDYPTFFGKTNHDFPNHNFRTNIRLAPGAAMPIVGTGRQGNTSEKKEPEISLDCAFFPSIPQFVFGSSPRGIQKILPLPPIGLQGKGWSVAPRGWMVTRWYRSCQHLN